MKLCSVCYMEGNHCECVAGLCIKPTPDLIDAKERYDKVWPDEGQKHDAGKTWRPGLIAPEFIVGIAHVLAFGAKKYSAGNWAKGMAWSRAIDGFDRHWTAWKGGEKYDLETGYSHLWHAGCCLMFLVAYEARGIGRDDRVEVGLMTAKEDAR